MKTKIRYKFLLIGLAFCLAISLAIAMLFGKTEEAHAASATDPDLAMFAFTKVGTTYYSVELKDSSVKYAKIPDVYNNLPVKEIASNGFAMCSQLEEFDIPASITKIGNGAFYGCEKLNFATLLEVENIGQNAFGMCDELDGVIIPSSVTKIGQNAFKYTSATLYADKTKEETASWNNWLAQHDGVVKYRDEDYIATSRITTNNQSGYQIEKVNINAPTKTLILDYFNPNHPENPYNYTEADGTLPILSIIGRAFEKANLDAVSIGGNYNHPIRIEGYAFAKADESQSNYPYNINSIYLGNNVYFADIYKNKEIPASSVFYKSTAKEIILPNTMDTICDNMFQNCSNLKTICFMDSVPNVLPAYITTIGSEAFKNCSLPKLSIEASDATVGSNVFVGWKDKKVTVCFTESEDAPAGWEPDWYGGEGTPLYAEELPDGWYHITCHMKVGDKWYKGIGKYNSEVETMLPDLSIGLSYDSEWKDNVSFNGDSLTSIPEGSEGNKVFYAKMTAKVYTLRFYMNGSSYATAQYTIFNSVHFAATPMNYTNFSGWHYNSMEGKIYTSLPQFCYGDLNFYATGTYNHPYIDVPGLPYDPNFPGKLPPNIIVVPPPSYPPPYGYMSAGRTTSESSLGEETVYESEREYITDISEQESILSAEETEDDKFILKRINVAFTIH